MRFKVLQLNMQFGQVWDEHDPDRAPIRVESTIEEILSHNADIVMLQEVEHAQPGQTHPTQPPNYTRLCAALKGFHSTFSYPPADPRELPFGIGLAIFSRWPLHQVVSINLPSPPVEFHFHGERRTPTDRLLIGATADVDGHALRLLNTHLLAFFMLNTSSEEHRQQRNLVASELGRSTGPTVLAGDFNVSKHESLLQQFANVGFNTIQSTQVTWRRRPYVLDHIFYNSHLRAVSHQVKPTLASDHHVLVAEFEFAG